MIPFLSHQEKIVESLREQTFFCQWIVKQAATETNL